MTHFFSHTVWVWWLSLTQNPTYNMVSVCVLRVRGHLNPLKPLYFEVERYVIIRHIRSTLLANKMVVLMACFHFFCAFGPSINKNEPRYRVIIMSLLTTLWVYISQSTSPFSVMWPARPIQLCWCRITWPRHGQSSGCTALWFPSMLFSAFSNINQIGSGLLDRPLIPGHSAQLFTLPNVFTTSAAARLKKAGKIHNTPFANQLNTSQHLANLFSKFYLAVSPAASPHHF